MISLILIELLIISLLDSFFVGIEYNLILCFSSKVLGASNNFLKLLRIVI